MATTGASIRKTVVEITSDESGSTGQWFTVYICPSGKYAEFDFRSLDTEEFRIATKNPATGVFDRFKQYSEGTSIAGDSWDDVAMGTVRKSGSYSGVTNFPILAERTFKLYPGEFVQIQANIAGIARCQAFAIEFE